MIIGWITRQHAYNSRKNGRKDPDLRLRYNTTKRNIDDVPIMLGRYNLTQEDEKVCERRAMEQWEKSLKRPDLTERDRVLGAIDAFERQAIAIGMIEE